MPQTLRYLIPSHGGSILCLTCHVRSFRPRDVAEHYCPQCHVFHDNEDLRELLRTREEIDTIDVALACLAHLTRLEQRRDKENADDH